MVHILLGSCQSIKREKDLPLQTNFHNARTRAVANGHWVEKGPSVLGTYLFLATTYDYIKESSKRRVMHPVKG